MRFKRARTTPVSSSPSHHCGLLTEQFPFIIKIKAKELSRSELALGTPEADQATANHSWHERGSRQTLSVRPPAPRAQALPQKWHLENSRFVLPCSIHTSAVVTLTRQNISRFRSPNPPTCLSLADRKGGLKGRAANKRARP